MTQTLPALLNATQCGALLSAAQQFGGQFQDSRGVLRRMGVNGNEVLSQYRILKYWRMPGELKQVIAQQVPARLLDTANEIWLLHFPKGGQLDCYKAAKPLFNCLSVPLNNGSTFNIWKGGQPEAHTNVSGDGYLFSLATEHQVPVTTQDDWYLCFLFLHHIEVNTNA